MKTKMRDLLSIASSYYPNCNIKQEDSFEESTMLIEGKDKYIKIFFNNKENRVSLIFVSKYHSRKGLMFLDRRELDKTKELLLDKRMQNLING